MKSGNIYIYIAVMASVTYIIRAIPLTLIKVEIKNPFIRSFLYYVPFATLSAMTFPAVIHSTETIYSAFAAFITAVILAYRENSLLKVAIAACAIVYIVESIII